MKNPLCTGYDDPTGLSRRNFLNQMGLGLGGIALADLVNPMTASAAVNPVSPSALSHFAPKAKRVIYLFQAGGPSQMDLFDHKPVLNAEHGKELPDSVRQGQRLTGMSTNQASLPLAGSPFDFQQHGQSGATISDLLPHTATVADELCFIKSMYTEAINHGPGVTMMQTGSQFPGRPTIGSWLSYGLGSMNENLPAFVVMVTKGGGGQPLVSRYWGNGFLPGKHNGVRFRPDREAVLYLNNPDGISRSARRKVVDQLERLHQLQLEKNSDPALENKITQYEMAFRMQASVPEVTDISGETESTLSLYGDDVKTPGSYAANCLQARRLAERGVRFIQLYHQGWDQHGNLPKAIRKQCLQTDQPSAGLIKDLKMRGMLDDTLVIWGGEFGRTNYCQGKMTANNFGRDHHPRCFSLWMAGGGVKPGYTHGETDAYGYNIAKDGVHVHDLHATMLHLLGIDHERMTHKYQGRYFRLTDVHGKLIRPILS
ncbi:MAG: hypothetical protein ACI9X0_000294 [Kiritimatiellia bacterium]|jgi:hypothetical protein